MPPTKYAALVTSWWARGYATAGQPRPAKLYYPKVASASHPSRAQLNREDLGAELMSASTTAMPSSASVYATRGFWERLWRTTGIHFVVFFIVAYIIYGYQPQVGASADALAAFYNGDRTRILIAAVLSGMAVLNLLWFAAALRTTLADAGQDGWGAAATTASAMFGGLFLLLLTVGAALAYSIAGSGNQRAHVGAERLRVGPRRVDVVPARDADHGRGVRALAGRADLERRSSRRASQPSCSVVLGGTTWLSDGFWAPDGAYTRFDRAQHSPGGTTSSFARPTRGSSASLPTGGRARLYFPT